MWQNLFDKYKKYLLLLTGLIVVLAAYLSGNGGGSVSPEDRTKEVYPVAAQEPEAKEAEEEDSERVKEIFVDVKGSVKKPGIYRAASGERINDLILRAGGFTEEASEENVNLAQKVSDEMVIYVPAEGESGFPLSTHSQAQEGAGELLDINQAEVSDFDTLPGIGPSKAAAIVDYRMENGPFKTIEDLKEVSGIGEGTFEKLKESIMVQ